MQTQAGVQISRKAFFQSAGVLLAMMILAGLLTRIVPAGTYQRELVEGRLVIQPDSFRYLSEQEYPVWRWFTAPAEVLGGEDALLVIVISAFILMVGGAFAVLERSGLLRTVLGEMVRRYQNQKYLLLAVVSLMFMGLGAFFGIFEEVIPLVPLVVSLAYALGWNAEVGLGMSILAANLGFSAAITNPFTIGVAQELAGLPLFSGSWFRIPIFLVMYLVLLVFLIRYARRVERSGGPEKSAGKEVYQGVGSQNPDELAGPEPGLSGSDPGQTEQFNPEVRLPLVWFGTFLGLILLVLISAPFFDLVSAIALPLVGLLFLIGGLGAGLLSKKPKGDILAALWDGVVGIAPGIILILMAVSVKVIITEGQIMDTILQSASQPFVQAGPVLSVLMIYGLALLIEFFVSSGSAKAFLLMPLLLPLADLVGVSRQLTVTAYSFGDGFSNTIYPTNPVLLIALGLAAVSYPRWLRWTLPLWGVVILISGLFLGLGVWIGYGPF